MLVDFVFDYLKLEFDQFFLKVFVYTLLIHLWISPIVALYPSIFFWIIKNLCDLLLLTRPFFKKKEENLVVTFKSLKRACTDFLSYVDKEIKIKKIKESGLKNYEYNNFLKNFNINEMSLYCFYNKLKYYNNWVINSYQWTNQHYPLLINFFFIIFSIVTLFLFFKEKISYNKQVIVFIFYGSLLCIKIGYYLSFVLSFVEGWLFYLWRFIKWILIKLIFNS